MRAGLVTLVLAYVLSQFYRAFLAVLSPVLKADLGATAGDLAQASGYWFLAFALMQLPVGWSLDRLGPRKTASSLLAVGAVGAGIFAAAQSPGMISLAMALIGAGCAPVLMATYMIFARIFPPARFGTLAGAVIGIGSLGNIAGSAPLAAAAESLGWRPTMAALALLTLTTAIAVAILVRDPPALPPGPKGRLTDLLRDRALWPILIMMAVCYAPSAALRGLWAGPYMAEVFDADATTIGRVTLLMGLAMIAGNFSYGPAERWLGTRKWLIFGGNLFSLLCLSVLWLAPGHSIALSAAMLAAIGFFGSSFPMVIAHGRAFLPPQLVGRGVTLMNFFGIGSAGLLQFGTGRLHDAALGADATTPFTLIFGVIAAMIAIGLALYLFAQDRTD